MCESFSLLCLKEIGGMLPSENATTRAAVIMYIQMTPKIGLADCWCSLLSGRLGRVPDLSPEILAPPTYTICI